MFEYVKNPLECRRQHICPKPDGSNYYNHNCTENNTCSNLKLLQRCDCLNILPEMTWQKLESISYTTKNGEERSKIFCSKGHCTKWIYEDFVAYWSAYLKHHHIHTWQTEQINYCQQNHEWGTFGMVVDFGENMDIIQVFYADCCNKLWMCCLVLSWRFEWCCFWRTRQKNRNC